MLRHLLHSGTSGVLPGFSASSTIPSTERQQGRQEVAMAGALCAALFGVLCCVLRYVSRCVPRFVLRLHCALRCVMCIRTLCVLCNVLCVVLGCVPRCDSAALCTALCAALCAALCLSATLVIHARVLYVQALGRELDWRHLGGIVMQAAGYVWWLWSMSLTSLDTHARTHLRRRACTHGRTQGPCPYTASVCSLRSSVTALPRALRHMRCCAQGAGWFRSQTCP